MEVDIDGSFSYAEPQNDAKASGKFLIICIYFANFIDFAG